MRNSSAGSTLATLQSDGSILFEPVNGSWLQNHLFANEISELSELNYSGKSERVYEVSEFGYFWLSYLPFINQNHSEIDFSSSIEMLKRLETKLNKIADIFKKPVIHKNGVSSLILPNLLKYTSTFIIHLVRDKRKVRDSILRVREERTGSKMNWWSTVLKVGKNN